jgi:hypothetical protein
VSNDSFFSATPWIAKTQAVITGLIIGGLLLLFIAAKLDGGRSEPDAAGTCFVHLSLNATQAVWVEAGHPTALWANADGWWERPASECGR